MYFVDRWVAGRYTRVQADANETLANQLRLGRRQSASAPNLFRVRDGYAHCINIMKSHDWFANVEHRPHPWPGLNWLTTALCVPEVKAAAHFYSVALGFVSIAELQDDHSAELLFARMRYRGTNITLNKETWDSDLVSPLTSGQASPFVFYLYVDDVSETCERMMAAGANIVAVPGRTSWGDLKARLQDPFGYVWDIAQRSHGDPDHRSAD